MNETHLCRKLLNTLCLGMESAEELIDKLLDLAVKHETPLCRELLNTLGLEIERAEELIDKLLDLAVKHETQDFFINKLPEILKIAKTQEEAFFLGYLGAMLSSHIAINMNPFGTLAGATILMEILAERKVEKTAGSELMSK